MRNVFGGNCLSRDPVGGIVVGFCTLTRLET